MGAVDMRPKGVPTAAQVSPTKKKTSTRQRQFVRKTRTGAGGEDHKLDDEQAQQHEPF